MGSVASCQRERFVGPAERADVAVVIVTYRSASDVDPLIASLRTQARDNRLRVIVADNDSPDDTLAVARLHTDVIAMPTGGNLGYAGGINAAMAAVGDADAVLVLNPDLTVHPGAVAALRARMAAEKAGAAGCGIVVPTIVDGNGVLSTSVRREPTVLRCFGDALFGARLRRRAAALSETVLSPDEYTSAHRIEWATGAALLISREVVEVVGEWDERYFLYSEETDYFRRTRMAGFAVWFEPAAVVAHAAGGSGAATELEKLLAVNRIRYFSRHHGRVGTALFHVATAIDHLLRSADPMHRAVLRTVLAPGSWATLPRARSAATSQAQNARDVEEVAP